MMKSGGGKFQAREGWPWCLKNSEEPMQLNRRCGPAPGFARPTSLRAQKGFERMLAFTSMRKRAMEAPDLVSDFN